MVQFGDVDVQRYVRGIEHFLARRWVDALGAGTAITEEDQVEVSGFLLRCGPSEVASGTIFQELKVWLVGGLWSSSDGCGLEPNGASFVL